MILTFTLTSFIPRAFRRTATTGVVIATRKSTVFWNRRERAPELANACVYTAACKSCSPSTCRPFLYGGRRTWRCCSRVFVVSLRTPTATSSRLKAFPLLPPPGQRSEALYPEEAPRYGSHSSRSPDAGVFLHPRSARRSGGGNAG